MIATDQTTNRIAQARSTFVASGVHEQFGYDGAETSNRRRAISTKLLSEDRQLTEAKRKRLVSGTRDIQRNYVIAAWAIRKHLDFVATHSYRAKTSDKGLNKELEAFIELRSKKENCDIAGRHCLRRMIRLAEARRTVDGDVGLLKLASGHIQAIESDRVRNQGGADSSWVHGVKTNKAGRALRYAVHSRTKSGFKFEREVSAQRMIWHGFYDRFDQTRGISPVAAALNQYRDLYEGAEYALAKMKISQLFGLIITTRAEESLGIHTKTDEVDTDGDGKADEFKYEVDFGKGPTKLEIEDGEKVEFLESNTPSTEFKDYSKFTIGAALKSLDIPYSFFDEAHTNFFGSKSAVTLYLKSAKHKRADVQEMLRAWELWQILWGSANGELLLPSGLEVDSLASEWIPDGVPWLDQSKELRGDIMAIAAGLKTRAECRRERFGDDWFDVIEQLEREEQWINEHEVTVTEAGPEVFNPETIIVSDSDGDAK